VLCCGASPDGAVAGETVPFVRVIRGSVVESVHCGIADVATADGRIIAGWGDADAPYPRSMPANATILINFPLPL
jgi:L-asparaginase II